MNLTYHYFRTEVWNYNILPSLQALCIRMDSAFHWACGLTCGRPHVVSATSELYPRKDAKAMLAIARPLVGDRPKEALKFLPQAMDHLYRLMKVDLDIKKKVPFSLRPLRDMYLGASKGQDSGKERQIPASEDLPHPVKVSAKGKKADSFEQDLLAILEFVRNGKVPSVQWTQPKKVENFYSWVHQLSPEAYLKWKEKVRAFNVPNSIFIIMEKLVSQLRHLIERGNVIQIGRAWAHGGGDVLAFLLEATMQNCFNPEWVEGDIKHFDQGVLEIFVNLFYSSMNLHLDPEEPDTWIYEMIIKFLLSNIIQRITKLFADLWAIVFGGVPSGAYNTSHMDSWIMALYFCLFCVYQVMTCPEEQREELETEFQLIVRVIVYGDDHLYRKGMFLGSKYFSGHAFAAFMKKFFNVEVRDIKDGISFASVQRMGWIIMMGATFLKHQFVVNENKSVGQPNFLPFRESREFLARAVWGRITKPRDHIDTLLSILGQTYGTYASNRDAYDRLQLFYLELLSEIPDISNLRQDLRDRITVDELKKIRQMGMTAEDLLSGFPSWDQLVQHNVMDWSYHDTKSLPVDLEDPVFGMEDVFD